VSLSVWLGIGLATDGALAWQQQKFFLGAADGPCMKEQPYLPPNDNVTRMKKLQDDLSLDSATLAAGQSDPGIYFKHRFRLQIMADVNAQPANTNFMQTFLTPDAAAPGWWITDTYDQTTATIFTDTVLAFGAPLRNAYLGYWIADEPARVVSRTFAASGTGATLTSDMHPWSDGMPVRLKTTGTLPAPFVLARTYWVVSAAPNTFSLAEAQGGAAIASTNTGVGAHTATTEYQLEYAKSWIKHLKDKDASKLALIMGVKIGPLESTASYATYLNTFFDDTDLEKRPDVVAYNHYPFPPYISCNWPGYSTKYFLNFSLARQEAEERPFWVVVQTQAWGYNQHRNCDPSQPRDWRVTFPAPDKPKLRFQIYSPLAYGAKGLFYWNYLEHPNDAPAEPPEEVQNPSLVTDCNATPGPLFYEVQQHNLFIKEKLGEVIMECDLYGTYHDTVWPTSSEIPSGEVRNDATTPVIAAMDDRAIAALYCDRDNPNIQYILVVDKDVWASDVPRQFQVTLKGNYVGHVLAAPEPRLYTSGQAFAPATNVVYEGISLNTTRVTDGWYVPGEGRLLQLTKDAIPPETSILSLMPLDPGTLTLSWTAPHEDGPVGGAAATWEIRESSQPITNANFLSGTPRGSSACATPGSAQSHVVPCPQSARYYAIRFTDQAGNVSLVSNSPGIDCGGGGGGYLPPKVEAAPLALALEFSGPNPASEQTSFEMAIPETLRGVSYRFEVFDLAGRRVRALESGVADAGWRGVTWNLRDDRGDAVANGVYLARLHFGSDSVVRRVIVVR
jgi:hypothetical protein